MAQNRNMLRSETAYQAAVEQRLIGQITIVTNRHPTCQLAQKWNFDLAIIFKSCGFAVALLGYWLATGQHFTHKPSPPNILTEGSQQAVAFWRGIGQSINIFLGVCWALNIGLHTWHHMYMLDLHLQVILIFWRISRELKQFMAC